MKLYIETENTGRAKECASKEEALDEIRRVIGEDTLSVRLILTDMPSGKMEGRETGGGINLDKYIDAVAERLATRIADAVDRML